MTTTESAPKVYHAAQNQFWVAVDVFRHYGGLDDYLIVRQHGE